MNKNSKKKNVKRLCIYGGAAIVLGSTIALSAVSCNNNSKGDNLTASTDDIGNDVIGKGEGTSELVTVDSKDVETIEVTVEDEGIKETEEFVPAVAYMSAEDLVKLSKSYAEYVNKTGNFSFENCKYDKFEAKDLYSTVYLTNIECFTNEETQRLIDNGIINDDIGSVMKNSFQFYSFYETDTYYKANNGDTNFIDLSMLFVNDEKANKVSNTMNTVLSEFSTADNAKIASNFVDTYAFFAQDTTLPVSNYDYSKSIYESDRAQLSAGSIYTLNFEATVIKDLSIEKGVTTYAVGQNLSDVLGNTSDISRIFEGCHVGKKSEQEKVMIK